MENASEVERVDETRTRDFNLGKKMRKSIFKTQAKTAQFAQFQILAFRLK